MYPPLPSSPDGGGSAHPGPDGPRLDASAGRRHRDEPVRAGLALGRLGPPRDRRRGRLPGRRGARGARPEPDRAPHGHAADGLPAGGVGVPAPRARARRRRRARGRQRDHVPDAAVAAPPARRARAPHPPRPLRRRDGPAGRGRRAAGRDAAAAAALPRHDVPDDLRGRPPRPDRARAARGPHPRRLPRRRAAAVRGRASAPQTPRLLYLGRLKQYKRVELLLDVLEAIPDAVLDIAGDGDHREALEAEIAAPRARRSASCCTGTSARRTRPSCCRAPGST